ncbi:N-acetylglucosamine-6-phosphate deacetylase [Defluviimonas aquaemixtae]|uniref:N-acetylglucosamine-6-phosphate deacetylase n=1 Tax=Albidovulum aquaemixtae TaxID=1542388 RepID=A0A2R8B5L6_9RHOB|nr:N-acetylglucosamine-6-phosphate deacetylase [Defluviimonas aquaemixtae]SPH17820.1 N-acetylglucosamine-6-phosphate deacetylase [Defluviimonas aquaemixtae]
MSCLLQGAHIFDGTSICPGSLLIGGGRILARLPADAKAEAEPITLDGGILAPGFVDLQLNGGGGVMLGDDPSEETVERIARAHARLGATTILPTLITDTPDKTRAAVEAVERAIARNVPGVAGLHLEGPHLSLARKGAHDPALIRAMTEDDLAFLTEAARRLPRLLVTLAPESVTGAQIAALSAAGVIVSLGHTDAGFAACRAAFEAGARVATHLFNAMSGLDHREPGLVGAVLAGGRISAGLIADGIHVHPDALTVALRAKAGPGEIFLVTDAMATAGSNIASFTLNGREIRRSDGRLTLADGTLAGADLDMAGALRVLRSIGWPLVRSLSMATSIPARVLGLSDRAGHLAEGCVADIVHLDDDLCLNAIWQRGERIEPFRTDAIVR